MRFKITQKTLMTTLSFLGLYLLSSGISWAAFTYLGKGPSVTSVTPGQLESARSRINLDLPKTEECPINGARFTKVERDIWEKRRPLAVMVENHADSRPSSGLSRADVVYEAVAEGGITRFLGIFYCGASAEDVKVAPVRSVRVYFINWASEYGDNPVFMHVGGANNFSGSGDTAKEVRALELLETIGWRVPKGNDLDTTYDSGFPVFWRNYERLDHPVATEHTMMISTDAAYDEAAKRGFGGDWKDNYQPWKFVDDKAAETVEVGKVSFEFWSSKPEYNVEWRYDPKTNLYLRFNGGEAYVDLEYNQTQLTAKNVVIQFVKEKGPVDRNLHMFYTTEGTGPARVFQNGRVIEGTWEKSSRTDRTRFLDKSGKEIEFVRGPIWIEAVPAGNDLEYD